MLFSRATALLAAAGVATAGPIQKRDGINDGRNCHDNLHVVSA
jgi:hypothetical protein